MNPATPTRTTRYPISHLGPLDAPFRDAVGLLAAAEVVFDLLQVFALGGLIVGELRSASSELTHRSRLARRDCLAQQEPAPHGERAV